MGGSGFLVGFVGCVGGFLVCGVFWGLVFCFCVVLCSV